MGSRLKAIILKNDLTAHFIKNVKGRHLTFNGGDYVLSPECVNRRLLTQDKNAAPESEIIFFENGSAPIPIDVDFSDKDKLKKKTSAYLDSVILENFLENTGFVPGAGLGGYITQVTRWVTIPRLVMLIVVGSIAYSLAQEFLL